MAETQEPLKSYYGLVAFFDILGYKQIIANNEIRQAASIVQKVLRKVAEFQKIANLAERDLESVPALNYLAFSDSILVYTNYSEDEKSRKNQPIVFIAGCTGLCAELFDVGLPVRGAIAKGEYFIEQTTFAGKTIVEAYEFANSMEMAGCIIVPTAETEFAGISDPLNLLFPYEVPLKGNRNQNLTTLNVCFNLLVADSQDPREFTISRFSQHNKTIGPEVIGKVNNTVDFLKKARTTIRAPHQLNMRYIKAQQDQAKSA